MTLRINDNGIDRDMTADEITEYEAWKLSRSAEQKIQAATDKAQATAKTSAQTKLAALGLTADEIAAL